MDTNVILYAILTLNVVLLALNIFFVFRFKLIKYLLEQPVVKKLSSSTKLKPYRMERRVQGEKPSNRGRSSRSGKTGRDSRQEKGSRSDKNKGARFPRARGARPDHPSRGVVVSNKAAEEEEKKPESTEKESTETVERNEASRPLPARNSAEKSHEASLPRNESPPKEEKTSLSESADQTEEIKHGRRMRVKKTPVFDEKAD